MGHLVQVSKRRTSGADYPHVWDSETYAQEGLWRQLYPRVASEIMLEDVYVRLYVDEPDVELLQPPPLAIAKVCVCVCLHVMVMCVHSCSHTALTMRCLVAGGVASCGCGTCLVARLY